MHVDAHRCPTSWLPRLGAVGLTAGIIALVSANEAMLATLVIAMSALWVIATLRHAFAPDAPTSDDDRGPLAKAA